jgi:hypothetical protein
MLYIVLICPTDSVIRDNAAPDGSGYIVSRPLDRARVVLVEIVVDDGDTAAKVYWDSAAVRVVVASLNMHFASCPAAFILWVRSEDAFAY